MVKKMFFALFSFILMLNFSYASESQLNFVQKIAINELVDDHDDANLQVDVITDKQTHRFSLFGYDPEELKDKVSYFELNFENSSVVLPLKLDEQLNVLYAEVIGSEIKQACDKITKNMYLLDRNKKRAFFFPYNKFGIACKSIKH